MTFWPRMFCAAMCWFVSMLAILVTAGHYLPTVPASSDLGQKLLFTAGVGVASIVVLTVTLFFWLWLWARKYW